MLIHCWQYTVFLEEVTTSFQAGGHCLLRGRHDISVAAHDLACAGLYGHLIGGGLQAFCGGQAPCPRSSCAVAITGDVMLLHGGQTAAGQEFVDRLTQG